MLDAGSAGTHSEQVCHRWADTTGSSMNRPGTAAGHRRRGSLSSDIHALTGTQLSRKGDPRY